MNTTAPVCPPKPRGGRRPGAGRRDQGLHEQLHVQLTPALKAWVMAQPGDAAAFVRRLIEQEYARQHPPEGSA